MFLAQCTTEPVRRSRHVRVHTMRAFRITLAQSTRVHHGRLTTKHADGTFTPVLMSQLSVYVHVYVCTYVRTYVPIKHYCHTREVSQKRLEIQALRRCNGETRGRTSVVRTHTCTSFPVVHVSCVRTYVRGDRHPKTSRSGG